MLHQAETKGGWRIRRDGPLVDKDTFTVNATKFLAALKAYLLDYQKELEQADWNDEIWQNLRKKMASLIKNCSRRQQ